jgi:hypothetical protein
MLNNSFERVFRVGKEAVRSRPMHVLRTHSVEMCPVIFAVSRSPQAFSCAPLALLPSHP